MIDLGLWVQTMDSYARLPTRHSQDQELRDKYFSGDPRAVLCCRQYYSAMLSASPPPALMDCHSVREQ